MAVHSRARALELENRGQYIHDLTVMMLRGYLVAGRTDNKDYRYLLIDLQSRLDDELFWPLGTWTNPRLTLT